ncbi:response regulator [Rhizobium oryzicola]|uniref:Response regulator n=1 Tax=Rhizobium oryzicola TaxID=1232668 RepID=A0ABT8SW78_9HYPH|nr:response regulator [Rhizobium oryzicola]MDO1582394.1 response regulator [Rhizobium oryzicola]
MKPQLVLIAEDETLIGFMLVESLIDAGFDSLVSVTAREAISALELDAPRFAALLTDIKMPGTETGWDVARRARELSPQIPVIYMTGDSADQWRAQGVPGSVLLQKPFAPAQLVTALTSLLNDAGMAGISH